MKKLGWQGATNPFGPSMEISNENALNITSYHWSKLDIHKVDGPSQLAMFNDFDVPAQVFINLLGKQTGDKVAQKSLTGFFESEFRDMSTKLDEFDSLTRDVHKVNTDEYFLIMGANRYRFYQGSYEERLAALQGMANEMTTQTVPLGATAVLDYRTLIISRHNAQRARMDTVGTDSTDINATRQILIKKLNKNLGGLKFNFGDDDDCQDKVNQYFPTNLLGDRAIKGHYQLIVPMASFRKICIHTFKPGEKIEIITKDADVWISMADNADSPIASGYRAVAGTTVIVEPSVLGDLSKKYIVATNVNLTTSCDLIFNIISAP